MKITMHPHSKQTLTSSKLYLKRQMNQCCLRNQILLSSTQQHQLDHHQISRVEVNPWNSRVVVISRDQV
ncbi:UNKNOWN [Stylonychia lemnae]|uniref:Uncharacterized protein n=1 Tax=Stylonychia lemnae TaxID=5949 RepID=A0A077ZSW1_STYLE|nr:UNKNOWN [Stylonychia lemnae]|eukprot:CDW72400.1 UNKNOWN [Stylonychia lemnae]